MRYPTESIACGEPGWPARLDALPSPPAAIWTAGSLPPERAVAIVGTRKADAAAVRFTRELAAELARRSVAVISGGALGIDTAAHEGALEGGGATWVVHATPLERLYPPRNAPLFERVLEQRGGWTTEVPPDGHATRGRFIARNRLIAALARVVLVVQAPARSGALSTAAAAAGLGHEVLAVPSAPWDPRGAGCRGLLRRGAGLCESAADVLDALRLSELRPPAPRTGLLREVKAEPPEADRTPAPPLPEPLDVVFAALGANPRHADHLAEELGLSSATLSVALVQLAMRQLAVGSPAGWSRL